MQELYKESYLNELFKGEYDFWVKETKELMRFGPEEDEDWRGELVIFNNEDEPPKYRETIAKTAKCVAKGETFLVSLFLLLFMVTFRVVGTLQ